MSSPTKNNLFDFIDKQANGCWIWQWHKDKNGYGYFCADGKKYDVHRYIYELIKGPIPPGLVLDHIVCNNPPCCNPDHVIPETRARNGNRWLREKTHCKRGHPYSGENLVVRKGKRYCKACEREYDKKRNGIRIR